MPEKKEKAKAKPKKKPSRAEILKKIDEGKLTEVEADKKYGV